MAEAQAAAKALGILVSNIVLLRLRCAERQRSDTRSSAGQGRAGRSRFCASPDLDCAKTRY
jgi:hypothetical protein